MLPDHDPPAVEQRDNGRWQLVFERWKDSRWDGWLLVVEAAHIDQPDEWSDDPDDWPSNPVYQDMWTGEGGWLIFLSATAVHRELPAWITGSIDSGGTWTVTIHGVEGATEAELIAVARAASLVTAPSPPKRGGGQPKLHINLGEIEGAIRTIAEHRARTITRSDLAAELAIAGKTLDRQLRDYGKGWPWVVDYYARVRST